jgi:hypothetical protein
MAQTKGSDMNDVPEMVERVARALYEARSAPGSHSKADIEILRDQAHVALEAMREPTDKMGVAAYRAVSALEAWDKFGEDAIMGPHEVLAIYRAMIDSALDKDSSS